MKEDLILLGTGKFAEYVSICFNNDSVHRVAAYVTDSIESKLKTFMGKRVIPFQEVEKRYPPDQYLAFVAIGPDRLNRRRTELYHQIKRKGYKLVSFTSTLAFIWRNVTMGDNCFIGEYTTLQPFTSIGNNVIVSQRAHIGHNDVIKDNVFISPHALILGDVNVGKNCLIGENSTLTDRISIADDTVIGPMCFINKSTKPRGVYSVRNAY